MDKAFIAKQQELLASERGQKPSLLWTSLLSLSSRRLTKRGVQRVILLVAVSFAVFALYHHLSREGMPYLSIQSSASGSVGQPWRRFPRAQLSHMRHNLTIAVTGANGKIGRALVPYLLQHGHRVVALDIQPLEPGDYQPPEHLSEKYKFDVVDTTNYLSVLKGMRGCNGLVHLAGIGHPGDNVWRSHDVNVVSSWNAMRAAVELGVERISLASSVNALGMVWGEIAEIDWVPLDEDHPCRPRDPYSLSKQILEIQADALVRQFPDTRIASLRISGVHAETQQRHERVEARAVKDLWGWVLLSDTVRALALGVTAGAWTGHERMFVVAKSTSSDTESTDALLARWWPEVPKRKQFYGHESLFDCKKAEALLGWIASE
ncbi:hypothetical protein BKA62DRAFT_700126 [Auriculariales sp. MPI-PUGE-AT-0066]|nr:hypothetical protein BKA62DRAFT_700126 [Auriculariales sp. MPI-PUGE-AT-0066]